MKPVFLPVEGLTMKRLLRTAEESGFIFLTSEGKTRFVVAPAKEEDRECTALTSNADFMAYLSACEKRARTRPRKSLQKMKEIYGSSRPALKR